MSALGDHRKTLWNDSAYSAEQIVNVAMVLRNALDELVEVLHEAAYLRQMDKRHAGSTTEGHLHLDMIGRTPVTTADSLVQNS